MSLKLQLDECRRALQVDAAPELFAAVRKLLAEHREAGILGHAVKAGDLAPMFRLPDEKGHFVSLSNLLRNGPVVVSFFWSDACPFCGLELEALAEASPEIERQGATLVAISPHNLEKCSGLPFHLLKDAGSEVAQRYGLAFRVPEDIQNAYAALGCPQEAPKGPSEDWLLPIPATYVIGTTGRVILSYLDTDPTTRLEPSEIIVALKRLRQRTKLQSAL